jgi:hypothetical protein
VRAVVCGRAWRVPLFLMEGGIAILLLLIIAVVVGGIAFMLFGTGGFLASRRQRLAADDAGHDRPRHNRPTTPAQEHTDFVRSGDEADAPRRRPPAPPLHE